MTKNSQTLLQVWDDESYDYVFQLLKVTHTLQRQIINKSNKPILAIKDEHPYFGDNQYVSVLYSTLTLLLAVNFQVQAEFILMRGDNATA